jgi:hypothetical protein
MSSIGNIKMANIMYHIIQETLRLIESRSSFNFYFNHTIGVWEITTKLHLSNHLEPSIHDKRNHDSDR